MNLYTLFLETKIATGPFVPSLLTITLLLLALLAVSYGVMQSRLFKERVLIVGASPLAHKLIEEIEAQPDCRYAIVGVVDDALTFGETKETNEGNGKDRSLAWLVR